MCHPLTHFRPKYVIFPTQFQTSLKNGKNLYPISDKQAKNTQFQAKMSKIHTRFQTKTAQKPYILRQHTYTDYIRWYPPPPPSGIIKSYQQ